MSYSASNLTDNQKNRYVEYVDIFSRADVLPSASIKDTLLLFDTFDGTNPLAFLHDSTTTNKLYQKICIYVTSGEYVIEINGKDTTVHACSMITIMPENITKTKSTSPDFNYFMMVVYPKLANLVYSDIGITYSNARMSLRHFISPMSTTQMQRAMQLYKDIKHDILSPDYEYKLAYIRALLNAMTIEGINVHQFNPMPLQGNSNSRQYDVYCRFLSLLNKHSIEHRSVQHYAEALGISSKYLSFVCVSYSNRNASTWIDDSVIQKAKALMVVHHYSFSEASEILHFPTVSSFNRFFKRVTGITPKMFVKQQQ